ncbi:uncharacterized protein LOC111912090 isoform X1 [Lactuca sativa]|uniref:uncharacterized protein LOC111912090 isoform X1 n=1 Tax=Lactuca sativa TaxID=4236 RepID=UPI0022B01927|nr:uncharacterized protein LOC111912090 isoform X1 [Lactuca sativa]
MGGGAVPTPATTVSIAGNHHSRPPYSPTVPPFSSNFLTENFNFIDEKTANEYPYETNFGPVPSKIEVQNAISDLRSRVMDVICATNSKSLGQNRLLDAYHLLQTDASVQKLVLSISSDIEVWDAILKNDEVRDLRRSLPYTANEEKDMGYKQELNSTSLLIKWIFSFMKLKITELIDRLEVFILERIQIVTRKSKSTSKVDDILEEKVRSSLLLSVVILLIVVITRSTET